MRLLRLRQPNLALGRTMIGVTCLAIAILQSWGSYPFWKLLSSDTYRRGSVQNAAMHIANDIPSGATVQADNDIAPWLVSRTTVYAVRQAYGDSPHARWVVLDLTHDTLGASLVWKRSWASQLSTSAERVISDDGIIAIELHS